MPLLLLHSGVSAAAHRATTARVLPASHLDTVVLPSHLVAYSAPTSSTADPTLSSPAPSLVASSLGPTTTTTTTDPPPPTPDVVGQTERGIASWYPEALPGRCASTWLPFGTVLTVTNDATGASTTCLVDDRETAHYPRIVDLSYSGFAQLDPPSVGLVNVTISW